MLRPFEVTPAYLSAHLDDLVDAAFADLQSQFLLMPRGRSFIDYARFQDAYETLKRHSAAFESLTEASAWAALQEDSLTLTVLRTILGVTPPELAELVRSERGIRVTQGAARSLEGRCRSDPTSFARLSRPKHALTLDRAEAMISVAVQYISAGAPERTAETVHRLDKVDTADGVASLQHVVAQHVPYAMLLYERYLGRPFAGHRDAVSEWVGAVMESAVEERLAHARITYRPTRRAERIPGFQQAPDFIVPDEFNPAVVIEAKITGDDGTARDKVARILRLAEMRDERERESSASFELVACIDGRGFGVRRNDMRDLLRATRGKVFTLATLDQLIPCTRLRTFVPRVP